MFPQCHMYESRVGWMVIFKARLEYGVRFPLHLFLSELVASHRLAINQFIPITYFYKNAYLVLCGVSNVTLKL